MKQTPIRKVSKAMAKQRRAEAELKDELSERCDHQCECCRLGSMRLWKHEIIFRKRGGDPLDPMNCIMLCGVCHNHVLYPATGSPLSTERQLEIAAERSGQ